ncbi:MAG: HAD-IIA family hydrolase [Desulfovibrionales bacterium]|nr:HAD-IIA family hydrolase [Desulfovibrionales bacterium]
MPHTQPDCRPLDAYSTFIFDLDGCIHFGNTVAESAPEFIDFLTTHNKRVLFLSNNSTHSPVSIRQKLETMGVNAPEKSIYLASTLTAKFLAKMHQEATICVAGTKDLVRVLNEHGLRTITPESSELAETLVLGRDLAFDFSRLKACANRVLSGATFYACNADRTHPSLDGGKEPETGALSAAVTAMCGITPKTFGKPTTFAYTTIMNELDLTPKECLMVGDNPATDILGAYNTGMDACWLMLNASPYQRPEGATHMFRTLRDMFQHMKELADK